MKRMILLVLVLNLVFAANFAEYENQVKERVLENGMRVLILERHNNPTAAFVNYVDAGSVDEFAGQSGAAHFLEHLAFKGTKTVGTTDYKKEAKAMEELDIAFNNWWDATQSGKSDEQIDKLYSIFKEKQDKAAEYAVENEFGTIYETEGGVGLNAYTSYDQTVYHLSLPSNKAELWCAMESDRIENPVYRQLYKERDVIQEERLMRIDDNPTGLLNEEFNSTFFKGHPYRDHIIGHMAEIQKLRRDDIQAFYEAYYRPDNMTLVIVGDVDADEMFDMVDDYFGDIPSPAEPIGRPRMEEPESRTSKRITMYENARPMMLIGYQVPEASHPDYIPLRLMMAILGNGRTSRLYTRMVTEEEKAVYAGGYIRSQKYPANMVFYLYPNTGVEADSLLVELDEEIARVIAEPVTEEELAKVKSKYKADFIYGLSSNVDLAQQLGTFQGEYGDWRELFRQTDKMDEVTIEDIQRVAEQYLSTPNRTIAEIKPPLAEGEVSE